MDLYKTLGFISSGTVVLPAILAALSFKRLANLGEKLFAFQMFAWVVLESISCSWIYFKLGSNHFITNITCLCEGVVLSLAMLQWIKPISVVRKYGNYFVALYVCLWAFFIYGDGIGFINQKVVYAENILLCILSGYILIDLVNITDKPLLSRFEFWVCAGIFVFYITTIEIETLLKFLKYDSGKYYSALLDIVNSSCNILYAIAFASKLRRPQAKWRM